MARGTRGGSADVTLDKIATDDLASGTYAGMKGQVVKLGVGAAGAMEQVDASNPLPVGDSGGSLTVDSGQLPATLGQKAMAASLPVVLPSDQAALPVSGSVTATFSGSVPAGTNNIGDVDVLTVPAPLSTTGGGTEAAALRVTIATDSTGVLSVDDNGGSLTVDGTVTVNAGTNLNTSALATSANQTTELTDLGGVTETAPATDTASSGLNGRLQRIAQRLTSLIGLLPGALGAGGGLKVDGSGTALPISAASLPLPTGAATEATLSAQSAKLPATLGQKAMAASLPIVIASDQSALPVSGSVTATFSGSLPAGTANIGDVDVLTMPGTYAEDAAHASGDIGHFVLGVRNDAGTALAGTTGDYIPLTTDATGAMRVTGGGGGTQYTEDVASAGAESMTLAGAIRQDTPASSTSTDGDYANLKTDSVGRLWVNPSGVTQPISAAQLPAALGGTTSAASLPVVLSSDGPFATQTGSITETAPATDTASSGLNGRLQRIAQRLTSLIAVFTIGAGTEAAAVRVTLPTDGTGKVNAAQSGTWNVTNVSGTVSLPTGASTEATLDARTGSLTETAPTTDTASSGINGRLQRVAQRLTSLIALLPTALGAGGGLKIDGSGTALPTSQVGSATNASGQVTISSTSATIIASRAGRRGVLLINYQTVAVYIDAAGGTATTSKMRLDPGAALMLPVTSAITGITAAAYTASPADAQIHYTELY